MVRPYFRTYLGMVRDLVVMFSTVSHCTRLDRQLEADPRPAAARFEIE